eukprot:scaffold2285_cov380-Prasinococcus_capsulatus_cf.AAC.5
MVATSGTLLHPAAMLASPRVPTLAAGRGIRSNRALGTRRQSTFAAVLCLAVLSTRIGTVESLFGGHKHKDEEAAAQDETTDVDSDSDAGPVAFVDHTFDSTDEEVASSARSDRPPLELRLERDKREHVRRAAEGLSRGAQQAGAHLQAHQERHGGGVRATHLGGRRLRARVQLRVGVVVKEAALLPQPAEAGRLSGMLVVWVGAAAQRVPACSSLASARTRRLETGPRWRASTDSCTRRPSLRPSRSRSGGTSRRTCPTYVDCAAMMSLAPWPGRSLHNNRVTNEWRAGALCTVRSRQLGGVCARGEQ